MAAKRKATHRKKQGSGSAATKRRSGSPPPAIEVRSAKDISKLIKLIKDKAVVTFVVTMDWCGHCKTFKKDIWGPLKNLKNRKVAMAEVNGDVLGQTPMANMKFDGYPSVGIIGKDMKMATVKGETGEPTNSLPNTRDLDAMTKLVTADPSQAEPTTEPVEPATLEPAEPVNSGMSGISRSLTPEAETNLRRSANRLLESIKGKSTNNVRSMTLPPPSAEDDLIMSETLPPQAPDLSATGPMAGGGRRRSRRAPRSEGGLLSFLRANTRRGRRGN